MKGVIFWGARRWECGTRAVLQCSGTCIPAVQAAVSQGDGDEASSALEVAAESAKPAPLCPHPSAAVPPAGRRGRAGTLSMGRGDGDGDV